MTDLAVLDELGDRLSAAFVTTERAEHERPPRRRIFRGRRRGLAIALAALVVGGGVATAARLVVHEGAPLEPAPRGDFGPRHGNLVPPLSGTDRIVATVPDPAGGLPWGLRLSYAENGQRCTGVGQVHRGRLGVVDRARVFHRLPLRGPDNCNPPPKRDEVQWGARGSSLSPTIVYGLAGSDVTRLVVKAPGVRATRTPAGREGGFLAVVPRGVPIYDTTVTASFRDGSVQTFGGRLAPLPRFRVVPRVAGPSTPLTVSFRSPYVADDSRDAYRVRLYLPHHDCASGVRDMTTDMPAPRARMLVISLSPATTTGGKPWCSGRYKGFVQFVDYRPGVACKPADARAGLCSRERPIGRFFTFRVR